MHYGSNVCSYAIKPRLVENYEYCNFLDYNLESLN